MNKFLCNLDHFYAISTRNYGVNSKMEKPFVIDFFNIHNENIHTVSFISEEERDSEFSKINLQRMYLEVKA